MYEIAFLWILALIWIVFATVQDLKMREIANWLNFSLIIFALGFRFFYSLFSSGGFGFFYQGLLGLAGNEYLSPAIVEVNSQEFNDLDCESITTLS